MNILKPIGRFVARSLNLPLDLPLDKWDALLDLAALGPTASGLHVSEHGAWNQATVFACIRLLQHDLSRHPVHVFRRSGENVTRQRDHPAEDLLRHPNTIHGGMLFRGHSWAARLSWGNSYARIVRTPRGEPVELWPVQPSMVRGVELNPRTGRRVYKIEIEPAKVREFQQDEILHDQETLSKDGGITGVSPIRQLTEPVLLALYGERHSTAYLKNYGRPNLLLKHPTGFQDDELKKNFLAAIKEAWTGANAMGIGLLENGLDAVPLSMPHTDAQLLETRRFQKEEIAQVFGVPMHRLADQQQRAQTSTEQNGAEYVEYTLAPLATSYEQVLERTFLTRPERMAGFFIRHNLDALKRGQFGERMEGWNKATGAHPMTINEARAKEDLPAVEGGDRVLVPLNMSFMDEQGNLTAPPKAGEGSNDGEN